MNISKFEAIKEGLADEADRADRRGRLVARARKAWAAAGEEGGKFAAFLAEFTAVTMAKAIARRTGLAFWPALFTRPDFDRRALLAAEAVLARAAGARYGETTATGEKSRGGFDVKGHYGLDVYAVRRAWFLAGCQDSPKFRAIIRACHRHGPGRGYFLARVRKSSTLPQVRALARACGSRASTHPETSRALGQCDHNALVALGRLSWYARWAALSGVSAFAADGSPRRVRVRDLNWEAVKVAQRGPRAAAAFMPSSVAGRAAWYRFAADPAVAQVAAAAGLGSPEAQGLSSAAFGHWLAQAQAEGTDLANAIRPAANIARLFGRDVAAAVRFIAGRSVHDAGQVNLPEERISSKWGAWLMAHPAAWSRANLLAVIEKDLGRLPVDAAEFRQAADAVAKRDPSGWLLALGVAPSGVRDYSSLFASPGKSFEMVPAVTVVQGEYALVRLAADDPEGVAAGLLTDCCQHLHGAAAACARAVWTRPDAAVWAVRKGGRMVAQAFVWVSTEGDLVLDSVEALRGQDYEKLASMFEAAARQSLGQFGLRRALVGNASYGCTDNVAPEGRWVETPNPVQGGFGYSDAKGGCRVVAEAAITDTPVVDVVAVEAAPEAPAAVLAVNALLEDSGVFCEHCEAEVHPLCEICPSCGQDISEWVDEGGGDEEDDEDE